MLYYYITLSSVSQYLLVIFLQLCYNSDVTVNIVFRKAGGNEMKKCTTYPVLPPIYRTDKRVKELAESIEGITVIPYREGYLINFHTYLADTTFHAMLLEKDLPFEEDSV